MPIPEIKNYGPTASCVILAEGNSTEISYDHVEKALEQPGTQLRLFGKPEVAGKRRMGVVIARADSIDKAKNIARNCASAVEINLG